FHRHLISLDLEQIVARLHRVADILEPGADLSLGDGFTKLRHQDVHAAPRSDAFLPVHRDILRLEEFHQTFMPALAAKARLLHAAERRRRIRDETTIEAYHAEIELLRNAQAARQVLRIEISH